MCGWWGGLWRWGREGKGRDRVELMHFPKKGKGKGKGEERKELFVYCSIYLSVHLGLLLFFFFFFFFLFTLLCTFRKGKEKKRAEKTHSYIHTIPYHTKQHQNQTPGSAIQSSPVQSTSLQSSSAYSYGAHSLLPSLLASFLPYNPSIHLSSQVRFDCLRIRLRVHCVFMCARGAGGRDFEFLTATGMDVD